MGKLINGKVRFSTKPQPFLEMSDKFYFQGQGYTKYSLSPIKNDFSLLSCSSTMFVGNDNFPIAKSIVNMKCYNTNNDVTGANVLGSDDMITVDTVDPTIEYLLRNPLGGDNFVVAKYDRVSCSYMFSNPISVSSRRASIVGQTDKFLYVSTMASNTLCIYCIVKDTMAVSLIPGGQMSNYVNGYHFSERKLYEDEESIIIGCVTTGVTTASIDNLVPSLIVINKRINTLSCKRVVPKSNELGTLYMHPGSQSNRVSTSSNIVKKKNDVFYSYFIGIRKDTNDNRHSVLIRLEYDRFKDSVSYEEYIGGFDISNLNYKNVANRSHCMLEVSSDGDVDTLTIFDGFKNINMKVSHPINNLTTGITTFKIDTFKHKVTKVHYEDIVDSDYTYHLMKMSSDTVALITPSSVVYCTKDKIDGIYRPMNSEPLDDPRFVMKDADQNIWSLSMDGSVYKLNGPKRRIDMYCKFEKGSYEYKDREINTNVIVGIKDYITGKMVKGNVILKLSDNCVFRDNDTNTIKVTTSDVIELKLPVIIKASGALTTQIDVNFDTEE